jgi:hypothetical protein
MALTPDAYGRKWPSGSYREVAWIEVSDEWLSEAFAQKLSCDFEPGLGPWVGAGAVMPSGEMVEAVRYAYGGRPFGFGLRIEQNSPDSVLNEFILETGIAPSAISRAPQI